jgi:hypothetical protein
LFGFGLDIPIHLFRGALVDTIVIGSPSLTFELSGDKAITLLYYGASDYKADWLYNLHLCGNESVQSLVGTALDVEFECLTKAVLTFSNGRRLIIVHDDVEMEIASFRIGKVTYVA